MTPFRSAKPPVYRLQFDAPTIEQAKQRLQGQVAFTRGLSPLVTAIFEHFLAWVGDPTGQGEKLGFTAQLVGFCNRLVAFVGEQKWGYDAEPGLRLGAALHWYVLGDDPRVATLRPYYKTVDGAQPVTAESFERDLLTAVDGLGELLFERARAWPVQTNETSRGLAWLLPCVLVGIDAVHLLEFGASAGLNLYAEQRRFDLIWDNGTLVQLGRANGPQFAVKVKAPDFSDLDPQALRGPEVLSRVGSDKEPVRLTSAEATRRLEACIWGDHRDRLVRLREGISLHHRAVAGELGPVAELHDAVLPDDVAEFLGRHAPTKPHAPVISFSTVVTTYLNDVEQRAVLRTVRDFARQWSVQHGMPWMWVRFEPLRPGEAVEPHRGWCRWFVELFEGTRHRMLDIGWAHPHLREIELNEQALELRQVAENAARELVRNQASEPAKSN